ncbi:glutamate-1-semialdehyde 2,1-aminomutase [Thermosediminibacter oceani]|uniref:Glutamate-1-semialdehyde 2,1-aminomutase n=1 Tax=Thermosediminibacter oceani (strain ATCC BAA-1034 / DSM 16646 / JW/IW-1228P) TaxID=555079 RepID=D9S0U0_THEOJ|nr:glutamate-1-semialdehyde 2,1-aminomutase [Thermosediminibacter oceani]ADL07104.1 glutamate-1-semialdehyde-2,1-aminomutase [Thermosediminibacter oceani DSM 16646]
MAYYPVMLDLRNKKCLVVGAGAVAYRKIRSLLECGAAVTVIATKINKDIRELGEKGRIVILERCYSVGDLEGFFMAFAASDDPVVNRQVAEEAAQRGIPVNVADDPGLSSFIVPSVLRRGDLAVAVSSGGKSPLLSKVVREWLEGIVPEEVDDLIRDLERARAEAKAAKLTPEEKIRLYYSLIKGRGLFRGKGDKMKSSELFQRAKKVMPGGVNSPVRAFGAVGGDPVFIKRGFGSRVWDEDGNEYIDYVLSWGPLILGHSHPAVVEALKRQAELGTSFGACTELEVLLAEKIREAVPSMEVVRMVNSGTEATMSAIRLARGYTGRNLIVKFAGCYHGHSDSLLIRAGSGLITYGIPDSGGVPEDTARLTLVARYNDVDMLEEIFEEKGPDIAAVIVEPVAGNMGVVPPEEDFLRALRELPRKYGALLIFDEVITGFRVSYSGAQGYYGIEPDLTTLGKIIGGGLPVGVYGGREDIMRCVSPDGPVYQAGTLSGNPLAMAAGLTTLEVLSKNPGLYDELDRRAERLCSGFKEVMEDAGIPVTVNRVCSMMTVFFTGEKVRNYDTAVKSDTRLYAVFFREMLKQGVYLPPAQFEAFFLSAAHSDEDIKKTIEAAWNAAKNLKKNY